MHSKTEIPFSSFTRELNVHLDTISYNELIPAVEYDDLGNQLDTRREAIKVGSGDIYRLLQPYLSVRFFDQLRAVLPLAVYLTLFQLLILRENVVDASIITGGLIAVVIGLMIFM